MHTDTNDELYATVVRHVSLGKRVGDITYTFLAASVGPFTETQKRRALPSLSFAGAMEDAEAYGEALVAALEKAYPVTRITVRRVGADEASACGVRREKGPGTGAWPASDEDVEAIAKRVLRDMLAVD